MGSTPFTLRLTPETWEMLVTSVRTYNQFLIQAEADALNPVNREYFMQRRIIMSNLQYAIENAWLEGENE